MNKTLAKNQGKTTQKRTMKVKKEVIPVDGEVIEPKKRGRKPNQNASQQVFVDDPNIYTIFDLIDPQLDLLADGERIQVGKLWMQLKKGKFTIHETQSVRKSVFESLADSDGLGYNKALVYLGANSL